MLEPIATFWSNNSGNIISGLILIVPAIFIGYWSALVPMRRKRRIRNREQRLRAQLETHLENMEDTALGLARAVSLLLRRLSIYGTLVALQVISTLVGARLGGNTVDPNLKLGHLMIFVFVIFWIWRGSRHVSRLLDPNPYREELEKKIKRLEDERNDL